MASFDRVPAESRAPRARAKGGIIRTYAIILGLPWYLQLPILGNLPVKPMEVPSGGGEASYAWCMNIQVLPRAYRALQAWMSSEFWSFLGTSILVPSEKDPIVLTITPLKQLRIVGLRAPSLKEVAVEFGWQPWLHVGCV